jgi:opacity protein-like surface antigen
MPVPRKESSLMTRARAIILAVGLLSVPASTFASGIELRFGGFEPRGHSNLFDDVDELYGVRPDDFQGFTAGIEYSLGLGEHAELGFHLDGYSRSVDSAYVDFEHEDGGLIFQELDLNVIPLGVTLRFLPAGRRAKVSPYVAAGADVFFYQYEEQGDFIDFFSEELEVRPDAFVSDGAAFGFHAAAGLRVPLNHDFSLTGEFRYQWAETDMDDDFSLNRLDLSGPSVTVGVHLRF